LSPNPLNIWVFQPSVTTNLGFSNTLGCAAGTYTVSLAPALPFLTYSGLTSTTGKIVGVTTNPAHMGSYALNITVDFANAEKYDRDFFALTVNVFCAFNAPICPSTTTFTAGVNSQPFNIPFT
jgi:hypothetical protein